MSNSTASMIPFSSSSSFSFPTTTSHHRTSTTPRVTRVTSTKVVHNSSQRSTITRTHTVTEPKRTTTHHTHSTPAGLVRPNEDNSTGGLSHGATIAIAVVVPIVALVLLALLGIFLWRRRKQRKERAEARRQEAEEYGYNPNNDPTLPAVAGIAGSDSPEMSEDTSGYRGWGNNTTANGTNSARKPSTNLSSVVGADDLRGGSPGSPPGFGGEGTMEAGAAGMATGAATGAAVAGMSNRTSRGGNGVNRGPSSASSTYSAAGRTDDSGDILGNYDQNYTSYNPGYGDGSQPVIQDVSARRNTTIQDAAVTYPQQGNSGIAQNF